MINFFKQLFQSGSGVSMMRFMSFISLWAGIAIAFYGMSKGVVDYSGISLLVSIFLSAAFGGKVMQKRIEANGAKADIESTTRPDEHLDATGPKKEVTKINVKVDNPD